MTGSQPDQENGIAVVFGATGSIGGAIVRQLEAAGRYSRVLSLSRRSDRPVDITDEASVQRAADQIASTGADLRLVIVATGFLHDAQFGPEKSFSALDPAHMAAAFANNAIGPALVMKHVLPLLPRRGRSVFAALSARVGSISDNRLGGWHSYRASKAALNQMIRTCSIELARRKPDAVCVALHPGTVDTGLSRPFSKSGLNVRPPETAARELLDVIDGLTPVQTGGFFDHTGKAVAW